jgi:uncharacterized membrane protein YphA (DoxX/SURF4 family)
MTAGARGVAGAWSRFWFAPQPTSTLAVYRIAFGLLVFAWTVAFLPDVQTFFGPDAIEPVPAFQPRVGWWGVLNSAQTGWAAVAVSLALLVASLCLAVGFRTRLASVIVFVGIISLQHRTPAVFNGGDQLLRITSFFLMFAPAGAALSVDRRLRHRDRFWAFPLRAPWAMRLIQVQLSVMYLCTVWEKLHGAPWQHGTAVSLSLGLQDLQRFPPPSFLLHSLVFSTVMTYLTLAIELMVGILVWNRAARPVVLALGAGLHIAIGLSLNVAFFSETVLTTYLTFLSPTFAIALALAARRRLARIPWLRVRPEALASAVTAPPPR